MKTEMIPTLDEQQRLQDWFTAARVVPSGQTIILIGEYMKNNEFPFTSEAINAAVGSSDLHGKLKFRRVPSPDNFLEVTAQWLKTLPEGLQAGLPNAVAARMADLLEAEYGNLYSVDNLNAAYARVQNLMLPTTEAKPEPSKKAVTDALMGQGGRQQTGRRNYAHDNDEPAPLNDSQVAEKVMRTLEGLLRGGHTAFAKQTNREVRQMMAENKSLNEIHGYVDNATVDYLAGAAVAKFLQDAPGATTGERMANRQHLQQIIQQGQRQGMSKPDIAKLVQLEYEGLTSRSVR
jgi:hypothetical protein